MQSQTDLIQAISANRFNAAHAMETIVSLGDDKAMTTTFTLRGPVRAHAAMDRLAAKTAAQKTVGADGSFTIRFER